MRATKKKINIRGSINSLEVGSDPLVFSRKDYILSSVRSIAYAIASDTEKRFVVSVIAEGKISVTRTK